MALPVQLPNLGPRAQKIVRYGGFALVGVIAFVFAFQATFPFDRVRDKIVEALAEKYDVTIASVERGILPGRVYFKAVSLRSRPTKADDTPSVTYIEQLEVNVGIFALLHGTVSVKLDAKLGAGHLKTALALSNSSTQIEVIGEDVPLASLPTRDFVGLPMSGKVRLNVDLDLPNTKNKAGKVQPDWTKAEGNLELACPAGCAFGDGKSKLKVALKNRSQQAMVDGGIDIGKIAVDSMTVGATLKNGKLDLTKLETKSDDGELHADFSMTLTQDLGSSPVAGCLRFRGSDSLLKREPKTHAALSTTGAPVGPDNLFHIKLDGQAREIRRIGAVCGQGAGKSMDNPGAAARPNLSVTPEPPPSAPPSLPPPAPTPPTPAVTPPRTPT
ncbi:MAG TPA: type II secretion system protein GspN, partial [Kofleriaceae bacterium]|nr:type II secretion system protein GspN [Kofleriaceae bacterium]